MTAATREKKLAFIRSFGPKALETCIMEAVYRNGAEHFLTDEQLDEITSEQVANARSTNRRVIRNRNDLRDELARYRADGGANIITKHENINVNDRKETV